MSVISYKCPNCGGELIFDPKTQKFQCEYCVSLFNKEELEAANPESQEQTTQDSEKSAEEARKQTAQGSAKSAANTEEQATQDSANNTEDTGQEAVVYSCPSCGAEIMTDETTAATFCYYCHNPVVLKGRLSGEYLPDKVLPFKIGQQEAEQAFLDYVHKKRFVPNAFFNKQQIEKLTGVYFPYWICDCKAEGEMHANATQIRVWRAGDVEYTETKFYDIERKGELEFSEMTRNALAKANRELVEGVQPFPMKTCTSFSMGYLSGFQAEKRDQEQEVFENEIHNEVAKYSNNLLRESVQGYSSVKVRQNNISVQRMDWSYVLLPVWTLTYKGSNDKIFYYAMNGITGKVCGKLPVDYKKVGILFLAIFIPVLLACLIGGYFI